MNQGSPFPAGFRLLVASQSPRRHSLLRDLGIPFTVVPSEVEEILTGDDAVYLAEANAVAKVQGAALPEGVEPGAFVLGTDTLVTADGVVMGKPDSADEAAQMLLGLSGRTHQVVSGVALGRTSVHGVTAKIGDIRVANSVTDVTFEKLDRRRVEAYLATGEWRGKAGGYAIQGSAGLFVSEICGEYSNVVGLPLCLLARMFSESGFDLVLRKWAESPV